SSERGGATGKVAPSVRTRPRASLASGALFEARAAVSLLVAIFSEAIPEPPQILADLLLQLRALDELLLERGREALHLGVERLAVGLRFLGADVAARREH